MKLQEIRDNHLGEIYYNQHGEYCKIIEYKDKENVTVEFDNGYIKKFHINSLKGGKFNNPYTKTMAGVGYIGEGKYSPYHSRADATIGYYNWKHLIDRTYNKDGDFYIKRPTYKDCTICNEWLNFQNFAKWFEDNLWNKDCNCVDKDILVKGNKNYSPDTCVLVDKRINSLFIKSNKNRGSLPIGVYKKGTKYASNCSVSTNGVNNQLYLGTFDTSLEAFNAYKEAKESYIKSVADEYKSKYPNFPPKLYQAMYNYEVEITD